MSQPLLNATDFAKFRSKDQDWFLGTVGQTIRDFCGWHIFPELAVTGYQTKIGNKGIIMLPTMNLVSVEQISIYTPQVVIDPTLFEMHEEGFIQYIAPLGRCGRGLTVTVDFTHGYTECPAPVAEVGYELTATALEKASGVATEIQRGPSSFKFKEFGVVLSDDQKRRLGPYTLTRV